MTSRLCCVVGCTNHGYVIKKWNYEECRTHNVKHEDCICDPPFLLYPFPTERRNAKARRRWTKIINRKDKITSLKWQPTTYSRVCSYHFADGQPTSKNPDPALHLGYEATSNVSACRTRRQRSIGKQSLELSSKSSKLDISDQPPLQQFPNSPQLDISNQTTTEQMAIHFDKLPLAEEIPISLPEQITAISSDDYNYTLPTKFPDSSDSPATLKKDLVTVNLSLLEEIKGIYKRLRPDTVPSIFSFNKKDTLCERAPRAEKGHEKSRKVHAKNSSPASDLNTRGEVSVCNPEGNIKQTIHDNGTPVCQVSVTSQCNLLQSNSTAISLLAKLQDNAAEMKYYTGFDGYNHFKFFFDILGKAAYHLKYQCKMLTPQEQLFLTLMKLRQAKDDFELAIMFSISESTVRVLFHQWVNFMYYQLKEINIMAYFRNH